MGEPVLKKDLIFYILNRCQHAAYTTPTTPLPESVEAWLKLLDYEWYLPAFCTLGLSKTPVENLGGFPFKIQKYSTWNAKMDSE